MTQAVQGLALVGDTDLLAEAWEPRSESLLGRLESLPEVEAATAVLRTYGLLHLGRGNVRAVNISGIDPRTHSQVTGLKKSLLRQKDAPGLPSFLMADYPDERGGFIGIER